MKKKLNSILLVDDDSDSNFFHERLLKQMQCTDTIYMLKDGVEGIDFLMKNIQENNPQPDIIFLDLKMPRMDGWEFLEEYKKFNATHPSKTILIVLTALLNPEHLEKTLSYSFVKGFKNKYLDKDGLNQILVEHFKEYM